jgi:hypothetical protein
LPPLTAIAEILRSPSLTALNIATLSAQQVGEKDAFSILHPLYTFPFTVTNAAPTEKPE